MLRRLRPRLTYANVAATLALVFAMGGSAVAASHYLITSKKQISPKALKEIAATGKPGAAGASGPAGPEGKQGAEGKPGPQGEVGPKGIQGIEGRPGAIGEKGNTSLPAVVWNKSIKTPGESISKPKVVVLEKVGNFTITGHCYVSGLETVADTYIETSEEGAVFAETGGLEEELEKGEAIPVGTGLAKSLTEKHEHAFSGPSEGPFAAQSKNGSIALEGSANNGVFLGDKEEPACYFSGTVTEEK
ncbi:MAG TPA: hypothetical protein VN618_01345 [Solirubrobacteraceae bacterium]|nr:hypothetical protein [Solirubrobacteraceae bacterium]